ncbi:phosphoribosylanthranilate isomerase, partial [Haliangium sp.]|uniref:phosphoribosylanthranilate isomerase n=1 Tax=Haliangium sp. TaxID=2663208 RepID=UPI003D099285
FVNQSEDEIAAAAAAAELDLVQLHGDEPAALCAGLRVRGLAVIKALGLRAEADLDRVRAYADALVDFLLVDAPSPGYGGAGRTGDWDLARAAVALGVAPVLLAGGLRPDNVAAAITAVGPAGVDVASGVEAGPGVKDDDLVRAFVRAARAPTPASG